MRAKIKCLICGKEYHWCRADYPDDPAWRAMVCSDNCHEIYRILSNEKNPVAAKIKLKKQDLSGLDGYPAAIKDQINQIFGVKTPENDAEESSEKQNTKAEEPKKDGNVKGLEELRASTSNRKPRVYVRPEGQSVD